MVREHEEPDRGGVSRTCPLQCRRRHGGAGDRVDWAGLPVNLDLVFSLNQRDNVYVQHLMRKRKTKLWPWSQEGAQPCACELAADHGRAYPDEAESVSGR